MPSSDSIRRFIRQTLGCACPDEVFRSVDVRRAVRLNSFIVLDSVIIVGDRLLVYVADAGSAGCVEEHLPVLIAAGRRERDGKGLNRFRLVLAAEAPGDVRESAERQFEGLRGNDEKVHLHVIGKHDGPFTAEMAVSSEKKRERR